MKYAFIEKYRDEYPIATICDVIGTSKSGYYSWKNRERSSRQEIREKLQKAIIEVFNDSRGIYGSPRIFAQLKKMGFQTSEDTVARIMKDLGIKAISKKRFRACLKSELVDFGWFFDHNKI